MYSIRHARLDSDPREVIELGSHFDLRRVPSLNVDLCINTLQVAEDRQLFFPHRPSMLPRFLREHSEMCN